MKPISFLFLTAVFFTLIPALASAQTIATFRIDLRPQMKDSTFIPVEHSIEIKGDQIPFSDVHTIILDDTTPPDSIYTASVRFPSLVNGELLKYKFIIRTQNGVITERRSRLLPLKGQEETLPIAGFNNFAH